MGKQSVSRQRYNEQRTRRDSQGRVSMRREKVDVIREEESTLGDIIGESQ